MINDRRLMLPASPHADDVVASLRRRGLTHVRTVPRHPQHAWRIDVALEGGTAEIWVYPDMLYVTTKRQVPRVEAVADVLARSLWREFGGTA